MACECKNADGTMTDMCMGTCIAFRMKIQDQNQERGQAVLTQEQKVAMLELLEMKTARLQLDVNTEAQEKYWEAYVKGFKEGIQMGIDIGKDIDDYR